MLPLESPMKYSFDASAFIDSWRRYYPKDIFKQLWDDIANLMAKKVIIASIMVKLEIEVQEDELTEYIQQFPTIFFPPLEFEQKVVEKIIKHPDFNQWKQGEIHKADPFVVALANTKNLAVVTYEKPTKTKNSIPAACKILNTRCISFLEFMREQHLSY
jgi:hypothetical protein